MSQNNPPANLPNFQLEVNPENRREFLAGINQKIKDARDRQAAWIALTQGRKAARELSNSMDAILQEIYDWLIRESGIEKKDYERISFIAQGGYGRGYLSPFSDIDLLVLIPSNPTPAEQAFIKSYLYVFWDLNKIELGHATKHINEAVSAVGHDLDSTTALLEMRLLAGAAPPLEELRKKVAAAVRLQNKKWFIQSKIAESKNRREKFGSSIYLLEPNVKEGEGGLRDIHSIKWLAYAVIETTRVGGLREHGMLTDKEVDAIRLAADFVLSVRAALHLIEGRKCDSLSFEKQPVVAQNMGYESDSVLLAEEKMMKDFYMHAKNIDRYCQKATRLMTLEAYSYFGEVLDTFNRKNYNDDYYIKAGVFYHRKHINTDFFKEDPTRVMQCFRDAGISGTRLSEELKTLIEDVKGQTDTDEFRTNPKCRDYFMEIMALKTNAGPTVHDMHDTGVLADYMPEFRKLFCLVRIDHYHRYTVDEHLIKTIYEASDLYETGAGQRVELADEARKIERWDLLNLALLLHDIGKGEGHGHVLRGATISQKMTQRMGLPPKDQEVIRMLILQHLKMIHISQRRDLEDPGVIAEMAGTVPDLDLLRMLYILTYCDTRAVGPGAWSDWKGTLLFELYRKTVLHLEGKNPIPDIDEHAVERIKEKVREKVKATVTEEQLQHYFTNLFPKYLTAVPPAKIAQHLIMMQSLSDETPVTWHVEDRKGNNYTEITTVAQDARGLLSAVCGALSSKDINILGLKAFSTKDGHAIDIFHVTDLRGNRLPQGFNLDRLKTDLNNVIQKKKSVIEAFPIRKRKKTIMRDLSMVKPAQVILDNESSPNVTILEVKTYDRPGLLYDITSVCNDLGYVIHLAMITTEAYRVVDVFYITDLEFNKVDPLKTKKLRSALEAVVT